MRGAMVTWRLVAGWLMAGLTMGATAQTISQPVDNGNSRAGFFGTGQSFTATRTGTVVAIDVRALSSWVSTLHLYNGVGSGVVNGVGTPAYSQPNVTVTGVGSGGAFTHIPLAVPFPVVAGNQYSFTLDGGGAFNEIYIAGNVYAGGQHVSNYADPQPSVDLAFRVFEISGTAQTITFANPGPQMLGTTPTLAATASSGLAPNFTSATPAVCTVTPSGVLAFVAPGNCTINADQGGNAVFAAAPQVARMFAVAAAVATAAIPTLADGALALMALLMGAMAWVQLKRR